MTDEQILAAFVIFILGNAILSVVPGCDNPSKPTMAWDSYEGP